jgi:hypothetical protein
MVMEAEVSANPRAAPAITMRPTVWISTERATNPDPAARFSPHPPTSTIYLQVRDHSFIPIGIELDLISLKAFATRLFY